MKQGPAKLREALTPPPEPPVYKGRPSPGLQRYIDAENARMRREDWITMGEELILGRNWCRHQGGAYAGRVGFGRWCAERGYDIIDARVRSATIWLVSPEGRAFLEVLDKEGVVLEHPMSIRAAYRRYTRQQNTANQQETHDD